MQDGIKQIIYTWDLIEYELKTNSKDRYAHKIENQESWLKNTPVTFLINSMTMTMTKINKKISNLQ